jgi:hypothetical protein
VDDWFLAERELHGTVSVAVARDGAVKKHPRTPRMADDDECNDFGVTRKGRQMKMIEDILNHLRAEYMEMPGLRLKAQQVQRLCGIEPMACQQVLDLLVNEKFLYAKPDGHYARLTDGHHPHPVKAELRHETRSNSNFSFL